MSCCRKGCRRTVPAICSHAADTADINGSIGFFVQCFLFRKAADDVVIQPAHRDDLLVREPARSIRTDQPALRMELSHKGTDPSRNNPAAEGIHQLLRIIRELLGKNDINHTGRHPPPVIGRAVLCRLSGGIPGALQDISGNQLIICAPVPHRCRQIDNIPVQISLIDSVFTGCLRRPDKIRPRNHVDALVFEILSPVYVLVR